MKITASQVPDVPPHQPVMVTEVLEHLNLDSNQTVVDGTLGLGGHSAAILGAAPDVRVIGIDRDPGALKLAQARLKDYGSRFTAMQGNFADLDLLVPEPVDAILLDLGISSWQLAERGFSFQTDAPLDFRMNPDDRVSAADLVAELPETELADLLYNLGEERRSRRIAAAIVAARRTEPIRTTGQLAEVIGSAVPRQGKLNPATKSFQALRIAVNDELGALERGLPAAVDRLKTGGRLLVISFHSLEDRPIKQFIKESEHLTKVNKNVIQPSRAEILANKRARSAKLRVAEKT